MESCLGLCTGVFSCTEENALCDNCECLGECAGEVAFAGLEVALWVKTNLFGDLATRGFEPFNVLLSPTCMFPFSVFSCFYFILSHFIYLMQLDLQFYFYEEYHLDIEDQNATACTERFILRFHLS